MSTRNTLDVLGCLAILVGMAMVGCVPAGDVDQGIVSRYQGMLADSGPQKRESQRGIGLLQPVAEPGAPPLRLATTTENGREQTRVMLSLAEAIRLALANDTDIRVASYEPAITRQQMTEAAAAFDYVVFGSWNYTNTDVAVANVFGGGHSTDNVYEVGLRQHTITGADWSLGWTMTRSWTNSAFATLPTTYEPVLALQLAQPLLRDGWPGVNLAQVNLARVNHRISAWAFRQRVEDVVTQVVTSYWAYVQARDDYEIQARLLEDTAVTQHKVEARTREGLAATLQVDQINASLESRRANLSAARKLVLDARDRLARRLADSRINVLTDYAIIPETPMSDAALIQDEADQMLTALRHNPALRQARLAIEARAIEVRVARNQTLPRLDLTASGSLQGLSGVRHNAVTMLEGGDYASYAFGLAFEYPLGNRAAEAALERARLTRLQSVATMQNTADEIALQLRERIRQANTAFDQLKAFDDAIAAAQEYRKKIEVTVSPEFGQAMTPERLQLLLGAQELEASLRQGRLQAVTEYNNALVQLEQLKGTLLEMNSVKVPMSELAGGEAGPMPQD